MPTFKHPCPHCGTFIDRDVVACPKCGTRDPFSPGRCPNCKAPLDDAVREAMAKPELVSALSLPLQARGETIGVLNLARRRGAEPFTRGDLELATVLAGQAAIAIDKARLIQDMRSLSETSQRLASALDLDEAASIIVEATARAAHARRAAFWLAEEVSDRLVLYKPFNMTPGEAEQLAPPVWAR